MYSNTQGKNYHSSKKPVVLSKIYNDIKLLHRFEKTTKKCLNALTIHDKWNNLYMQFLQLAHSNGLNTVPINCPPHITMLNTVLQISNFFLLALKQKQNCMNITLNSKAFRKL